MSANKDLQKITKIMANLKEKDPDLFFVLDRIMRKISSIDDNIFYLDGILQNNLQTEDEKNDTIKH